MMMEPLAVKPMSMKFAGVKPAVRKPSKSPVKSPWPAVEPAAVKSPATVEPAAAMRSCSRGT